MRLDGWFYCSDGGQARQVLTASGLQLCSLVDLCVAEGLYIPHRFKRPYVRSKENGTPYVTGSSIQLADPLQGCAYLSNKLLISGREKLMLKPGTILVTCSGDIGRVVYVNNLFEEAVGSPDLLRVEPDPTKVLPGYLYTFLSSPMGRGLLSRGTYGGVIPHIETAHVLDLPVPRLEDKTEAAIHRCIVDAALRREEANWKLTQARSRVYDVTSLPRYELAPVGRNLKGVRTFSVSQTIIGHRLEARFHDTFVREMQRVIRSNPTCEW